MARSYVSGPLAVAVVSLLGACGGNADTGFGPGVDSGGVADALGPGRDGASSLPQEAGSDGTHVGADAGRDGANLDATLDGSHDTGNGAHDGGGAPIDTGTTPPADSGTTDASHPQIAIVYGESADTLYSLDPTTKAVTTIGFFIGCDDSGVIDIALDKSSVMYATTGEGLYTVDTSNAFCTLVASGTQYPNSLSFVPAGTLDPTSETLVGYQGATYVSIDTSSGAITNVGTLDGTHASSGDIVSVIGGGTYLTVTGGSDCTANDCLVEVNPTTGALITNYGSVQHSTVYGLAFWAGDVYGFDDAGQLFEVTFPDAGGLGITTVPIPNAPFGLSFYGAGSTTAAPRH